MAWVDPGARRRVRINGRAHAIGTGGILVDTDQVFANCPRFIQTRTVVDAYRPSPRLTLGHQLTESQREWIETADTFFVATSAPGMGSDASHRGGNPGFVRAVGSRGLSWPDYDGNAMYMTLGNLDLDPRAGLLFIDWTNGHTLHLSGRARADWDPDRAAALPGGQRVIDFDIDEVRQIDNHLPLAWHLEKYSRFKKYSRFNPS